MALETNPEKLIRKLQKNMKKRRMLDKKKKRIPPYKFGRVLSWKLMDDLYTVAQMIDPYDQYLFFDLYNKDGKWSEIDLSSFTPLFISTPIPDIVRTYTERVIPSKNVNPREEIPYPNGFIWPIDNKKWRKRALEKRITKKWLNKGGWPMKGGQLRTTDSLGTSGGLNEAEQIIAKISFDDQNTLTTYEPAGSSFFSLIERLVLINKLGYKIADPNLVQTFPDSNFLKFPNWERTYNSFLDKNDDFREPDFEEKHFEYLLNGII